MYAGITIGHLKFLFENWIVLQMENKFQSWMFNKSKTPARFFWSSYIDSPCYDSFKSFWIVDTLELVRTFNSTQLPNFISFSCRINSLESWLVDRKSLVFANIISVFQPKVFEYYITYSIETSILIINGLKTLSGSVTWRFAEGIRFSFILFNFNCNSIQT